MAADVVLKDWSLWSLSLEVTLSTPSPCETSIEKTAQHAMKYAICNGIAHTETQGIHPIDT
jgi:hypothetical protein